MKTCIFCSGIPETGTPEAKIVPKNGHYTKYTENVGAYGCENYYHYYCKRVDHDWWIQMGGMFLTILIICGVFFLLGFLNDSSKRKAEESKAERHKDIEDRHREMLALIDECPNPLVRRERKAQVETMIHSGLKEVDDINYHPAGIKEVTTAEERRARRSAELAGKKYVHSLTRRQAEAIADEIAEDFISSTGETRKDLVRIFPPLGDALAKSYAELCDIDIKDAKYAVDQVYSVLKSSASSGGAQYKSNSDNGEVRTINGIEMIPVGSSAVSSIGYDPGKKQLYVIFTSGAAYEYDDVPVEVYESFMSSPSKGRFVNDVLTVLYKYRYKATKE